MATLRFQGDRQAVNASLDRPKSPATPAMNLHKGQGVGSPNSGLVANPWSHEASRNFLRSCGNKTTGAWVSQYVADAQGAIGQIRLTPGEP
jgi:hypothetical protein